MKHVIIIGGGFAGLKLALRLHHTKYEVLLIDRWNHHQFQPLFYQVATAGLEPSSVSFPLRSIFHHAKNIRFRLTEVQQVVPEQHKVITAIGEFTYDYLVLATGATTNFFGNKNFEANTFPMKSTSEAINIRQRMLMNFEDALNVTNEDLESLMTFVITGGGPTGVELSGTLAEMRRHVFPKDYPELDFTKMKIILLEGSASTLGNMSEASSKKSKQYLEDLGVTVMVNTRAKDYDGKFMELDNGERIRTSMVIWAAGIKGNVIEGLNKEIIARGNRLKVDRFSRVEGYEDIFAIGDIAYMVTEKYPESHPQLANVALSQATTLSKNFRNMLSGKPLEPFEYHNKGTMATVGKRKAVVDLPFVSFQGFFAWFIWMGLHLLLLMGMKNKLFVFINWVISYFSNDSTLRLIFYTGKKKAPAS